MAVRVEVNAHHWLIGFTLLALSALFVPAQAQTMAPDHAATTPGHGAITGGMANADIGRAPRGRLEKYRGLLRTTELDGADVYDEKGTDIGTVDDLLVNNSGKVDRVVISVGAFSVLALIMLPYRSLCLRSNLAGPAPIRQPLTVWDWPLAPALWVLGRWQPIAIQIRVTRTIDATGQDQCTGMPLARSILASCFRLPQRTCSQKCRNFIIAKTRCSVFS